MENTRKGSGMDRMISVIFSLFFCFFVIGQEKNCDLKFDFYEENVRLYTIGESHFNKNAELQNEIIDYLRGSTDIDLLVMEIPEGFGSILSEYVLTGAKENETRKILDLFHPQVAENFRSVIANIKKRNDVLPDSLKIRIVGVDYISFDPFSWQMRSLDIIFPEIRQHPPSPFINDILKHITKKYKAKKGKILIDSLIHDLQVNKFSYQKCLGTRLQSYEIQLNEIKTEYLDSWKKHDLAREEIMTKKLSLVIDSNVVSIMICGSLHAMYKDKDSWYQGYPFTSMVAAVKTQYPDEVFSIITEYYERKLIRLFPEFNVLNSALKMFVERNSCKYRIITSPELSDYPTAKERCDMVIIQDEKYH